MEYINKCVAELLEKLRIEFTKSRSRHSNDNALAESKNSSVVRKQFGYSHIPTDTKGKQRKIYRYESMMRPSDKLKSLPDAKGYLKLGLSFEILD